MCSWGVQQLQHWFQEPLLLPHLGNGIAARDNTSVGPEVNSSKATGWSPSTYVSVAELLLKDKAELCCSGTSYRSVHNPGLTQRFIWIRSTKAIHSLNSLIPCSVCSLPTEPSYALVPLLLSVLFCSVYLLNIIWQLTYSGPQPQHPCNASMCQKLYLTSQAVVSLPPHLAWEMSTSSHPLHFQMHLSCPKGVTQPFG